MLTTWFYVISDFRRDVDEICALPGYYAALSGSSVPTFRDNLSVPSSRINKSKKKALQNRTTTQSCVISQKKAGLTLLLLLLRKLSDFGLSAGYVSWFRSCLTSRTSSVRYCGALSSSYEVFLVCHKDPFWDNSFSTYLSTTCVVWSSVQIAFSLQMTSKYFVNWSPLVTVCYYRLI